MTNRTPESVSGRRRRQARFVRALKMLGPVLLLGRTRILRFSGFLGVLLNRLRLYGPSSKQMQALAAFDKEQEPARVAQAITAETLRAWVVSMIRWTGGSHDLVSLIEPTDLEKLRNELKRPGTVIAIWHLGPIFVISAFVKGVDSSVLSYRVPPDGRARERQLRRGAREIDRALAVRSAVREIRAGKNVLVAVDGGDGSDCHGIEFLGRPEKFKRGVASICRLTRAPLLTLGSWWSPELRRFRVEVARIEWSDIPDDDPDQFDRLLTQRLASWIEALVLEHPGMLAFQYPRHLPPPD